MGKQRKKNEEKNENVNRGEEKAKCPQGNRDDLKATSLDNLHRCPPSLAVLCEEILPLGKHQPLLLFLHFPRD